MLRVAWVVLLAMLGACGRLGFDRGGGPGDGTDTTRPLVARYVATMTTTPQTVTIAPIDMTRTFITCELRIAISDTDRQPTCELVTPTSIEVTAFTAEPTEVVHIQVIELPEGNRVQRGTVTVPSTEYVEPISIAPVDLSRSFALYTRREPLATGDLDNRYLFTARLISPSMLALERFESGNNVDVAWQVVELATGSVTARDTQILDGQGSASVSMAFDRTRSFAIATSRGGGGVEADNRLRARLDDNALVLLRLSQSLDVDASAFVIELPEVSVEHLEVPMGLELVVAVPIQPVDPARAAVFQSSSGGLIGDAYQFEVTACTTQLTTTQLILERQVADHPDTVANVFIVRWN